jgi:hypothetical protein
MYPPVVSVAGFANVDRGLFRAVSNLTKEMECCKEQIRLVLICKSVKINLQVSGGRLVLVRIDTLIYRTGTFTHISVRVFLLMDGHKLGVWRLQEFYCKECQLMKRNNIYAHAIFCNELPFTTKMITTINMLPFGPECIYF